MPEEEAELERTEVEALLETRRELGPRYDAALVDSFADRVEAVVSSRVEAELARSRAAATAQASAGPRQLALGIVSVVACIPLVLALGLNEAFAPLVVSLLTILGINLAHAHQSRRTD